MLNALRSHVSFAIRNDLVVTGYNPERADYDNRNGAIYGEAYYVIATVFMGEAAAADARDGLQWAHPHKFVNDLSGAEKLLRRIEKASQVREDLWQEIEPCYGTQAWLNWNADHPETWND